MIYLSLYLLTGLLAHKLLWEVLKRRATVKSHTPVTGSSGLQFVKAVKVAILLGIMGQTVWAVRADVLPILDASFPLRAVGVALFTAGLVIAMLGRVQLGDNWSDIETARILRRQAVVANGVYAYIRHPIYVGDLLLLLGIQLSLNSWLVVAAALLAPVVLWKAVREEKMLAVELPGYEAYCGQTKRFIPFLV